MRMLRDRLRGEPLAKFDETWQRVEGKRQYVHNASTRELTYQVASSRRGKDGMGEAGVLPFFRGIAVHDGWDPYWGFPQQAGTGCAVPTCCGRPRASESGIPRASSSGCSAPCWCG